MSYLRILASALIGTSMACATSGDPKKTSVRATKRWISSPIPPPLEKRTKQSSVRKDSVLPNGLPVTVIEQSHRPIVSVRLFLPHGSASDPPSAIGGSYFGLTLLGDYHEERSDGRRILAEKSKRLQILEMGGRLRISVGVDASSIGIQGYAVDVDSYIKQLAGVLQKPRAGARSFNGRKESMIHALKDVDLTSDGYFYELLNKTAFGEKSAYSRPVYGTLESLEELSHEDAVAQQKRLLGIEGAHLVIVGKVKAKAVLMTAMKHFGRWNRKTKAKRYDTTKPHVQKRRHVIVVPRQTAHMTTLCAARPLSDIKGQDAELDLLASVFGLGMQSRLLKKLRDEAGLVYSASAQIAERKYGRVLFVCTRLPSKATAVGTQLFLKTMDEMKTVPASAQEIRRAKAKLVQSIKSQQDTLFGSVYTLYRDFIHRGNNKKRLDAVQAVDAKYLSALASKVFDRRFFQLLFSGNTGVIRSAIRKNNLGKMQITKSGLLGDVKKKE
jgi:zinc protease